MVAAKMGGIDEISVSRGDEVCPECGHHRDGRARSTTPWFLRIVGISRPAVCTDERGEFGYDGWGSGECGCTHLFHGS